MKGRIEAILTLFPLTLCAWDSPLPSMVSLLGNSQAAFGNPAAAALGPDEEFIGAFAQKDFTWNPEGQVLWSVHHQDGRHASGVRYWYGQGHDRLRLDLAWGLPFAGLFTGGLKLSYVAAQAAPNLWLADAGLQFRPLPQLQAAYRLENIWEYEDVEPVHHGAAGVRPFAASARWYKDLELGYELELETDGSRRDFLLAQVPLPLGLRVQSRWEWDPPGGSRSQGSLGVTVQAGGTWALAWGLAGENLNDGPQGGRQEAAIRSLPRVQTPYLLQQGTVAELDLNRTITEGRPEPTWFGTGGGLAFLDLMDRLDALEADGRTRHVLVKLGKARCGWGMGEEIRNRLLRLRERGKRVTAYLDQVTPLNYYLASAADVIAMQPSGYFAVSGFAAEVTFYRGLFDKLGVQAQFLRHGRYKSFDEPFTRKEMSPEARADLEAYLASLWDRYLDAVAASRRLPRDTLRTALEAGQISLAHARRARLIDTLIYEDEAVALAGGKGATKAKTPVGVYREIWDVPPKVALVVVDGDLVLGRSASGWLGSPDLAGSRTIAAQLRRARLTPGIRAVVLRVDSPGGSAQAADVIWREVELLKKAGKPVVASVGGTAASGGYYIICGADRIFAAPNSTVGSIGVLWGKFVLKGLYHKVGIATGTVKTSPHADAGSSSRPWDSTETRIIQEHMDEFYRDFVAKVAAGRKLSPEAVDSAGEGRVFTGTQSLRVRLVDSLGGLEDAVREAGRRAGIGPGRYVELVPIPGDEEGVAFPLGSRFAAAGGAGTDPFRRLADTFQALSEAQLWAVDPELAGWNALTLESGR